jgi:hypothetical protein
MQNWLKTYHAVFTTNRLALIACFLTGYLLMQAICSYYDFNLVAALAGQ